MMEEEEDDNIQQRNKRESKASLVHFNNNITSVDEEDITQQHVNGHEEISYDEKLFERQPTLWNRIRYVHGASLYAWAMHNILLLLMMGGVVMGFIIGSIVGHNSPSATTVKLIGFPGELLLRMLKALVLPLVSASLVVATASLAKSKIGDSKRLFYTILLYFTGTTLLAVILGITCVSLLHPGSSVSNVSPSSINNTSSDSGSGHPKVEVVDSILGVFENLVPENLVQAAYNMDILGIVAFSLVLGATLGRMEEAGLPLLNVISCLNEAVMRIVMGVMWYAPIGIMSLIAARLSGNPQFWKLLMDLGVFTVTVLLGLSVHILILLPAIYAIILKKNPYKHLYAKLGQAVVTAIGTDSSSATLPISMKLLQSKVGLDPLIVEIVLPLGTTINMNGTALYEAVAAIFIAQLHGIELSFGEIIVVAFTATLAAVGAAGIPEAGIVTLTLVLTAVGLPLTDIGLLLTIDWFLDRCRTVVNVLGDCIGASIVDHFEKRNGLVVNS